MTDNLIKVLIVDDEQLARERLKRMLESNTEYTLCGEASNGKEALLKMEEVTPDIVLLDIRMPGIDGLEVAEQVCRMEHPPAIIFCTAYDEYALSAFKFQAIDYLLKPASAKDLSLALEKAQKLNQLQIRKLREDTSSESDQENLVAHTWNGYELIPLESILYFRADQKYVSVIHMNGETITDHTLKELEQRYPERFLRSHRNSLVNLHQIQGLEKTSDGSIHITLKHGEHHVPVSRRHYSELKALLQSKN